MALKKKRRNQIAWLFFVQALRERDKVYSILDTCFNFSKEYKIPSSDLLYLAVEKAYLEILYPSPEVELGEEDMQVKEKVNELVWYIDVLSCFKKNIKIGECSKLFIGNKATEFRVDYSEMREYYLELTAEIVTLLGKDWWTAFDEISLRIEKIEEDHQTSKANSAEASS